jgi:hypothetical protein
MLKRLNYAGAVKARASWTLAQRSSRTGGARRTIPMGPKPKGRLPGGDNAAPAHSALSNSIMLKAAQARASRKVAKRSTEPAEPAVRSRRKPSRKAGYREEKTRRPHAIIVFLYFISSIAAKAGGCLTMARGPTVSTTPAARPQRSPSRKAGYQGEKTRRPRTARKTFHFPFLLT